MGTGHGALHGQLLLRWVSRLTAPRGLVTATTLWLFMRCIRKRCNGRTSLPVRNFARDRTWHDINGEFEKKAIVNALICQQRADRNNTPWMVLAGTFPAMDVGTSTALTVWCLNDDGSADGGSYSINMGRNIGIDDFQITTSQAAKPPKNWRYRYTDMTGEVRVRTFDYRVANPTTNLTPPALA